MEVSSKEDLLEEHSRKGHLSSSYSSTGPITRPLNKERLAVIEEGDISKVNANAGSFDTRGEHFPPKKSFTDADAGITDTPLAPVRHRRTQSHCPPMVQVTCANNIKPKICHR